MQNARENLVTEKALDGKTKKWKQAEIASLALNKVKRHIKPFKDRGQTVATHGSLLCLDQTNSGTRCVAKAYWHLHLP